MKLRRIALALLVIVSALVFSPHHADVEEIQVMNDLGLVPYNDGYWVLDHVFEDVEPKHAHPTIYQIPDVPWALPQGVVLPFYDTTAEYIEVPTSATRCHRDLAHYTVWISEQVITRGGHGEKVFMEALAHQ